MKLEARHLTFEDKVNATAIDMEGELELKMTKTIDKLLRIENQHATATVDKIVDAVEDVRQQLAIAEKKLVMMSGLRECSEKAKNIDKRQLNLVNMENMQENAQKAHTASERKGAILWLAVRGAPSQRRKQGGRSCG
eukprot:TRINITY_DN91969_c0_g1_i1.p1 TRINITY_DN91969_c0_g1~~TRINITY_DN91969_c0_g1_i1.p1  ORF type:complete len:137 (+),score=49.53 TRINITY_DN91969_c0_g1_i1:166-576(+)